MFGLLKRVLGLEAVVRRVRGLKAVTRQVMAAFTFVAQALARAGHPTTWVAKRREWR